MVADRGGARYRSILFSPYQRVELLLGAVELGADAVMFDLEDMVPIPQKAEAREVTRAGLTTLSEAPLGRFVRINAWQTGQLVSDVLAIVTKGLDGVALPKPESVHDVTALDHLLTELEIERGLPIGHIEIIPLAESAPAIFHAYDLIMASPRVKRYYGVINSTQEGDAGRSMNIKVGRDGHDWIPIGSHILMAARAAGISNILGATAMEPENLERCRQLAELSVDHGANGALCMHPGLVAIVNEVYSPTQAQIDHARDMVITLSKSLEEGESSTVVDGELATYSHIRTALDLLTRAKSYGMDVGEIPDVDLLSY